MYKIYSEGIIPSQDQYAETLIDIKLLSFIDPWGSDYPQTFNCLRKGRAVFPNKEIFNRKDLKQIMAKDSGVEVIVHQVILC